MRLLEIGNVQLTETGIYYRQCYKACAKFINFIGDIEFDFEFCIEKDAIGQKIITIKLEDETEYPGGVIKKQLKEWVKDNILI